MKEFEEKSLGDILREAIERRKADLALEPVNANYLKTEALLLSPYGVQYLQTVLNYYEYHAMEAPNRALHDELMIQLKNLKQPV